MPRFELLNYIIIARAAWRRISEAIGDVSSEDREAQAGMLPASLAGFLFIEHRRWRCGRVGGLR